jgi:hypothetical protein
MRIGCGVMLAAVGGVLAGSSIGAAQAPGDLSIAVGECIAL